VTLPSGNVTLLAWRVAVFVPLKSTLSRLAWMTTCGEAPVFESKEKRRCPTREAEIAQRFREDYGIHPPTRTHFSEDLPFLPSIQYIAIVVRTRILVILLERESSFLKVCHDCSEPS